MKRRKITGTWLVFVALDGTLAEQIEDTQRERWSIEREIWRSYIQRPRNTFKYSEGAITFVPLSGLTVIIGLLPILEITLSLRCNYYIAPSRLNLNHSSFGSYHIALLTLRKEKSPYCS